MQNKITIVIPIYNEELNIWLLINSIFSQYLDINILVIDDFSTDNSIKIVRKKILKYWKKIKLIEKVKEVDWKWLTFSIIKWINSVETKYFIVMDWDFQHPVKNIKTFINLFKKRKNIIIWQRRKINFDEKKYRILVSKLWNFLINLKIFKNWFWLKDPLSWFFWWETLFFQKIIIQNKNIFIWSGYKFLFEFLKLIKNKNVFLWTFYYDFWKRKFWESKINTKIHIDFIKWLLK